MSMKRYPPGLLAFLLLLHAFSAATPGAWAQSKPLTVEDLTHSWALRPQNSPSLNWMRDGKHYSVCRGKDIARFDIRTGQERDVLFSGKAAGLPQRVRRAVFSPDEEKILLIVEERPIFRHSTTVTCYLYDKKVGKAKPFVDGAWLSYATFSPDSKKIAYVQDNNLFYHDLTTGATVPVTQDGKKNHIINGSTDWVYEEEFSFTKAFFWSPDGKRLAYYRFDESGVREFSMEHWVTPAKDPYPLRYGIKYPKPGEKNAEVAVYIYHLSDQKKIKVDLGADPDIYIISLAWANEEVLSLQRLNRLQNHWTLLHADAATGNTGAILEEKSDTYVDVGFCDDLTYLRGGRAFIMSSERSGYKHFYLYQSKGGRLLGAITSGRWEVDEMLGVREKKRSFVLYYTATEASHLERHFYSVSCGGGGLGLFPSLSRGSVKKKRVSRKKGTHRIQGIDPTFQYYVAKHSSVDTVPKFSVRSLKTGTSIRALQDNEALESEAKVRALSPKELFTFSNSSNQLLYGYFIKPPNFDPSKKHPLLIHQYSGPGGYQMAKNEWGGSHYLFHQMLAQQGYVVAVIDPRGTGGRGRDFRNCTYGQLGTHETEDFIDAAIHLGKLPFVDAERLGIWGWSYGGYMAALCLLKAPGYFKTGISVAGISDWRLYDTIYTERYLGLPAGNPEGYETSSPLSYAANLKGDLLLIHGTEDDNVHFQHTALLQEALIRENKQFSSFFYPNSAHSLRGGSTRTHLYTLIANYLHDHL